MDRADLARRIYAAAHLTGEFTLRRSGAGLTLRECPGKMKWV